MTAQGVISYNRNYLQRFAQENKSELLPEQNLAFDAIMQTVANHSGTGKTF